jgi:2-polyprenyl-3-methyl-5-hydroxy-6-metoxy-1,4-benzoquinol methylase
VPTGSHLGAPRRLCLPDGFVPMPLPHTELPVSMLGGETAGRAGLTRWLGLGLDTYDTAHDALAADGTSRLSPYLHFGCVSARELAVRARRQGADAFVRQLCWRDFYAQLLSANPATQTQDLRPRRDRWLDDLEALDAWKAGLTGYPLVDAGMRQLRAEGWMHNRARLVTASFLVKHLGIDWREGARHFFDLLLDGDVAQNVGNWQWVAGVGTDTRPNRVFNPVAQARKLDRRAPTSDGGFPSSPISSRPPCSSRPGTVAILRRSSTVLQSPHSAAAEAFQPRRGVSLNREQRRMRGTSFGPMASAYERSRPLYPEEAVRWLVGETSGAVLDLGAGTGKLTRQLVALGHHVVAVDPLPEMLQQLREAVPGVAALEGTGEAIPLGTASVDVVTIAQAFHWLDPAAALPEVARVLRPGGTLGLIWNVREESLPWAARLSEIIGGELVEESSAAETIAASGLYGPVETREFRHEQHLDRTGLLDLVVSSSSCAVQEAEARARVLAEVGRLYDSEAVEGRLTLPYVTDAHRAARL